MPLQFAWEDLKTNFSEVDAGQGYDKSMPYICVQQFFEIQANVEYYTQDFWLMQMDLCLDLELSMQNYLRIFLAEVWSQ